jgi:hypothetical protein
MKWHDHFILRPFCGAVLFLIDPQSKRYLLGILVLTSLPSVRKDTIGLSAARKTRHTLSRVKNSCSTSCSEPENIHRLGVRILEVG